jgi:hypothetical protein
MPNCVKNVRNQRLNSSVISDYINTVFKININNYNKWFKSDSFWQLSPTLITRLSTTKKDIFNLLNNIFTHNPQDLLIRLLKRN